MTIHSLELGNARLTACDPAEGLKRWREAGVTLLLALEGEPADVRREWLERAGLSANLSERLVTGPEGMRFELRDESVMLQVLGTASLERPESVAVTLVVRERLLLVLFDRRPCGFERLLDAERWGTTFRRDTSAFLMAAMLLSLVDGVRVMIGSLVARVRAAGQRMDTSVEDVPFAELVDLKEESVDAEAIADELLAGIELARALRRPDVDLSGERELIESSVGPLHSAERRLDRVARALDHLQARYDGAQQDKTNRRLGALTVLSAIFLPLTLLAGIWGMNFQGMPELGWPWGYPLALSTMAAVAIGLFQWFRTHGWLR